MWFGSRSCLGRTTAAGLLLLALSGCGYQMVGRETPGPARLQRLWLGPVENESREPLFGPRLRSALAREAVDRAGADLSSRAEAEALLSAKVVSLTESRVAFVSGDLPRVYSVRAEVEARLATPGGEVIWKGLGLSAQREFPGGATVDETQSQKNRALELLARDLSREILVRASLALAARQR